MNHWGKGSRRERATLHPDLQLVFDTVLQLHDCSLIKGHRGKEEQNAAYASGHSQLEWPFGRHNKWPSMAVDAAPYIREVGVDGNNPAHLKYFRRFAGMVEGVAYLLWLQGKISHVVRWGGDWDGDLNMDDQKFNDLYHFELVAKSPVG